MRKIEAILACVFGVLSVSSFVTGEFYEGLLEMTIAVHNLSDYLREAK
jgi:hypothetical protein